jgi:hypothetical protein
MMSRKIRLLIAIVLVEGGLAGLWWYMLQPDPATGRTNFINADGPAQVSQTMGTAMGVVLGFAVFLYFIASAADRRRAAAKRP